ncbi:MAG: DUF2177 family protein [Anaerolineales bacterium]|nr:DUF2177 family protein [Anaerolineales bacterium]
MKPKLYLITLLAFLAIDSIWLRLVAPSFYQSQIGYILAENPNFLAAGCFICCSSLAWWCLLSSRACAKER